MLPDVIRHLPAPAVFLLLCARLDGVAATVAGPSVEQIMMVPSVAGSAAPAAAPPPLATTTMPYRVLSVVPWPRPTDQPDTAQGHTPTELVRAARRALDVLGRADTNTICGYIGGDPDLPATCSSGSHCVLDAEHGAVGCCPNGVASCTTGVFTGCVDGSSGGAATEINPYVYTCTGGSYCYKNLFAGGYSQYGCGSASTIGASVAATATGKAPLTITSVYVSFTRTFTDSATRASTKTPLPSASTPSTTSSSTSTSSTKSLSSLTSTTLPSTTTSTSSSRTSTSSKQTSTGGSAFSADPGNEANTGVRSGDRAGIIIGATISAVAGIVAIIALVTFCMWKRRQRRGTRGSKFKGPTGNFRPLHSNPEDYETGLQPEMKTAHTGGPMGTFTQISAGAPLLSNAVPTNDDDRLFFNGDNPDLDGRHHDDGYRGRHSADGEPWATPAIGPAAAAAVAGIAAAALPKMARKTSAVTRHTSRRSSYRNLNSGGSVVSRVSSSVASNCPRVSPNIYPQLSPYAPYGTDDIDSGTHTSASHVESNRVPQTHEIGDLSRGYQDVLNSIGEEDPSELSHGDTEHNIDSTLAAAGGAAGGPHPLNKQAESSIDQNGTSQENGGATNGAGGSSGTGSTINKPTPIPTTPPRPSSVTDMRPRDTGGRSHRRHSSSDTMALFGAIERTPSPCLTSPTLPLSPEGVAMKRSVTITSGPLWHQQRQGDRSKIWP